MRAKLKSLDQIDPRLICCDKSRAFLLFHSADVLEVDPTRTEVIKMGERRCRWCGYANPFVIVGLFIVGTGLHDRPTLMKRFIAKDVIDIDEGEVVE
jgi:hypothetical protein